MRKNTVAATIDLEMNQKEVATDTLALRNPSEGFLRILVHLRAVCADLAGHCREDLQKDECSAGQVADEGCLRVPEVRLPEVAEREHRNGAKRRRRNLPFARKNTAGILVRKVMLATTRMPTG